jgi:hypothetical protein
MEVDQQLAHLMETIQLNKPQFSAEDRVKISISEYSINAKGELCFQDQRWVPNSEPLQIRIMQETHNLALAGYPGRDTMYAILVRQFYWPKITNNIRCFVQNCHLYGSNKVWHEQKHGLLKPLLIPKQKWQEILINFVIKLPLSKGCKNMVVITDHLGKGIIIKPMETINIEATTHMFIKTFYHYHSLPSMIMSD